MTTPSPAARVAELSDCCIQTLREVRPDTWDPDFQCRWCGLPLIHDGGAWGRPQGD